MQIESHLKGKCRNNFECDRSYIIVTLAQMLHTSEIGAKIQNTRTMHRFRFTHIHASTHAFTHTYTLTLYHITHVHTHTHTQDRRTPSFVDE